MVDLYKFLSLLIAINLVLPNYGMQVPLSWIGGLINRMQSLPSRESIYLLIRRHKTDELRDRLLSDPTVNVNELGDRPLLIAVAFGYDDIVDLLCEYGADPLLPLQGGRNVLDIAVSMLKSEYFQLASKEEIFRNSRIVGEFRKRNEKMMVEFRKGMQERIARYERIVWLCKVQVKLLYGMPIFAMGKGSFKKRYEIGAVLTNNLLPLLMGSKVANFKPTIPLPKHPPFLLRRYPSLHPPESLPPVGENSIVIHNPPIESPSNISSDQQLSQTSGEKHASAFNKKSLRATLVGAVATSYALYWYLNSQKVSQSIDDQFATHVNVTNIEKSSQCHMYDLGTTLPITEKALR